MLPSGAISRLYIGLFKHSPFCDDEFTYQVVSPVHIAFLYFSANAARHDSGNYTCSLGDVAQATVMVHVLIGKTKKFKLTSEAKLRSKVIVCQQKRSKLSVLVLKPQ